MKRVALQFAMQAEADPLISKYGAEEIAFDEQRYGFKSYQIKFPGLSVRAFVAGKDVRFNSDQIGSQAAALLADYICRSFKPDLILNAGTCGGYESKGASIAEVFICKGSAYFHSRRSSIPYMREYGRGQYRLADITDLAEKLGLKTGTVSSGDALDCSKEDAEYIEMNQADLKEMEAASIAWVANSFGIPMIALKGVTDFVDHPADTAEQFKKNLGATLKGITCEVDRVLNYLNRNPEDSAWRR